jgi:hypothetical protein
MPRLKMQVAISTSHTLLLWVKTLTTLVLVFWSSVEVPCHFCCNCKSLVKIIFLGTDAELQKATVSFVMFVFPSVCLSIYME